MCVTCGCSDDTEMPVESHPHLHSHAHPHPHSTDQHHPDIGEHILPETLHQKTLHQQTMLNLEHNLLSKNNQIAVQNRAQFQEHHILALNLVSSPGAGKTALLTRTITDLKSQLGIHVIEGDQATANDAQRIEATGCNVVQINTGTGCHLDAAMVEKGLQALNPPDHTVVMIENVGNLICPALFDLGEQARIIMLSVTEGEDKPIKYPHLFRASDVMILTKIDLLPYVPFDVDRCLDYAHQVNPNLQIFQLSALTGVGLQDWYDWLGISMASVRKSK